MHHQQIGIAAGEHARADADRCHGKKGVGRCFNRVGQLHATHFIVLRCAQHARFGIGLVSVMRGLRQDDFFTVKMGFLCVHQAVERRIFFTRNPFAGVEHCIKGFTAVVGKTFAGLQAFNLQPVVQQKINGWAQAHVASSRFSKFRQRKRRSAGGRPPGCCSGIHTPRHHSTSKMPQAPMPPPMHMVTATRLAPRRLPSIRAWPVRRWPLTP